VARRRLTIDILNLIDRLEELVDHGWRMPGKRVAIDESKFLDLIDQMRITIPPEIKQARELHDERDRFVGQAQEEARRLLAQAREDAARLLDEQKLRLAAESHADSIRHRAEEEARRIREGADDYAETRLRDMAETLAELQKVVGNGLDELGRRRAGALQAEQPSLGGMAADAAPLAEDVAPDAPDQPAKP